MRKQFLEKKLKRLNSKLESLKKRAMNSEDAAEVRSLTEQLEELNEEIAEVREELDAIENETEERSAVPEDATPVNTKVLGSFQKKEERSEDITESMEYRSAFKAYLQNGTPIPAEFRSAISADDTSAAIPVTVMNEVINTVRKRYGNLYSKVRKMSVPGGVEIPIGSLEASFKWIADDTVSPRQKLNKLAKVSFGYHTAEIRIAQTFLSQILTVSAFEAELSRVIAIAYLKAMDQAIVNGSGNGAPLGILNDARVTNNVTMTASAMSDWTKWRKNFFASLPLGYRGGEFIFAASTVDAYLETMADSNNNPIFRQATGLEVNDGDAQNPNGRFFGREISLVEPDILPDFDSANANDVIGIYWQPEEYAVNENFGFTMRRYFDEETNEWVDKALTVVDGKILNPTGFYLIKKG
jgi:HK97 family phage major capsid protein